MTVTVGDVTVPVRPGETVFDALIRGGIRYPFACRRGRCAACKVLLIAGEVVYTRTVAPGVFSDEERAAGVCLSCTAVAVGDVEIRLPV
jgi:ferredoxin